jgi:predicted O-methyltransferase YrrM
LASRVAGLRNVPRDAGQFLHILVQATGARRVLEIGTSNGYSALWLATALEATGGRLVTVERDSGKAKMARKNLRAAGLADRVEVKIGEAGKVLRRLHGPFDLVFFDASKEDQLDHLKLVWDRVQPGGLVVSDNALTHVAELSAYTAFVRSLPEADSLMVPIGNGFEVTLRMTRR